MSPVLAVLRLAHNNYDASWGSTFEVAPFDNLDLWEDPSPEAEQGDTDELATLQPSAPASPSTTARSLPVPVEEIPVSRRSPSLDHGAPVLPALSPDRE